MPREHLISDLFSMKAISGITMDSTGETAALVSSNTYNEKKKPTLSSIMAISTADGKAIAEFGSKESRSHSPCFSQDGTRLAFLEHQGERDYLVIRNLRESTGERIDLDGRPRSIQWHGGSILILKEDPADEELKARHEEGYDGTFFEEEERYSSLYLYTPGSGFKKLTESIQVWEFSAGGGRVAVVASEKPLEKDWYACKLYTFTIDSPELKLIYDPGWRQATRPRMSPDGAYLAFLESLWSDQGLSGGDVVLYEFKNSRASNLTEGYRRSFGDILWTDAGFLSALWFSEGAFGISKFRDGWNDLWSAKGTVMPGFSPEFAYSGGKYAFAFTDEKNPPEVYVMENGKEPRAITGINSGLSDLKAYSAEVVKWKSTDGKDIYGVLRSLGKDSPLVVYIHGGPTSFSGISFLDRMTLFLGQGFSVFAPNYRGSTGMGREYAEANRGDMGGMDFTDIMSGIEHLKSSGRVSTDNIFLTGGSYGGFMTSWAITQTDMFRAAAGLFGISDWLSFHGTTRISDWDQVHYDDDPYRGELFSKFSPIRYVENIRTPVILMHGRDDPFVPVGQYLQFYRALKDQEKEVRLLIFPREGHGFREKRHQEQFMDETVTWFRKYMVQ